MRGLSFIAAMAVAASTAFGQTPAAAPATTAPAPATTAAAPAATPAGPAAPGASQTADEAFQTRVKTLEEKVVDLKEKIHRTKARLVMLQERVLGGDLSNGARAVIIHKNEMGPAFILESVAYALDGASIFTKVDTKGDLDKKEEFEVFSARIVPGNHNVIVRMVYRGSGGPFTYFDGYKFKLQSNQTFTAEGGKVTTVKVVGYEKGGITQDMKDKPAIRYDISTTKDTLTKPAAPAEAKP